MIQHARRPTLVVVGTGMAGISLVRELHKRQPGRFQVRLFGGDPGELAGRVLLSSLFQGFDDPARLTLKTLDWFEKRRALVHAGIKAEKIDLGNRVVVGAGGKVVEPFDGLILATGASLLAELPGMNRPGVFRTRTLQDFAALSAQAREADSAVVWGADAVAVEIASRLAGQGLAVTLVAPRGRLLPEYLDTVASELLLRKLEAQQIAVRFQNIVEILGDGQLDGVQLDDGTRIACDILAVATASRPNVELARGCGLAVDGGVVIDGVCRASEPDVYALGDCVRRRPGLVDPVDEQARRLADVLFDLPAGPLPRRLVSFRVAGLDIGLLGKIDSSHNECEVVSRVDPAAGIYKKVLLEGGRVVGAVSVGEADPGPQILEAFRESAPLGRPVLEMLDRGRESPSVTVPVTPPLPAGTNKIEAMKAARDGLDCLPDLLRLAANNNWQEMTEDDKQRAKWYGLFFRKQTPGHFMMRIRLNAGRLNARQFRVLADISDEFGKGFCDLTTRQQVQLRWFTLGDTPEIWRRLEAVGLHSRQTGMDNVRGVCGCAVSGLTPNELFDAGPVVEAFNDLIVGNREFTNLPRKFNVTITSCLENCTHTETQDIALVPAYRELDGAQVNGFNILVGGKQGSGGYCPATPLDVFVPPAEAAEVCAEIVRGFRDHGSRANRNRVRLAFLIEERGIDWFREEVQRRAGRPLHRAGMDMRRKNHVDHLGIHPQRHSQLDPGPPLFYVGFLVPVGRITTAQMRAAADLAQKYGDGDLRITPGQNLVLANIPEHRLGALSQEPLFAELPYDPSPIMRGLVCCTGNDYCHLALIETKGWALEVARELERRTAGHKIRPLTIHWSGCSAGCGLHQVATIGLQGCRSRINGEIVDAAHVCVKGSTGPHPVVASDLMYDVPCTTLADALEPLVRYLPRE